jgi:pimeloyl-ACP methyl ester carboxylesterase
MAGCSPTKNKLRTICPIFFCVKRAQIWITCKTYVDKLLDLRKLTCDLNYHTLQPTRLSTVKTTSISYKTTLVDGFKIFYREAGDPQTPAVLLLHGFPTSSHMFRNLIPELSGQYHVVAPDLPGFGFSDAPDHKSFDYTFDHLAEVIGKFTEQVGLKKFAVYVFDYGAPTGFRLALNHPERITALISQNGNAYEEGLSKDWGPVRTYWENPTQQNRDVLRSLSTLETTRWQYHHGVTNPEQRVAPETIILDQALLDRPQSAEIQLDLIGDYKSNVALYPKFQEYFRTHRPPTLAVWGKNDPFFLPAGAEAYRRDNPSAKVVLYDTGHFALETHAAEIGAEIRAFLGAIHKD